MDCHCFSGSRKIGHQTLNDQTVRPKCACPPVQHICICRNPDVPVIDRQTHQHLALRHKCSLACWCSEIFFLSPNLCSLQSNYERILTCIDMVSDKWSQVVTLTGKYFSKYRWYGLSPWSRPTRMSFDGMSIPNFRGLKLSNILFLIWNVVMISTRLGSHFQIIGTDWQKLWNVMEFPVECSGISSGTCGM